MVIYVCIDMYWYRIGTEKNTFQKALFVRSSVFSALFSRLQAECCPHGRENESHCSNFQPESEDENQSKQTFLRGDGPVQYTLSLHIRGDVSPLLTGFG